MTAACRCIREHVAGCYDAPESRERTYLVTVTIEVTGYDSDGAKEQVEDAVRPLFSRPITIDQVEEK